MKLIAEFLSGLFSILSVLSMPVITLINTWGNNEALYEKYFITACCIAMFSIIIWLLTRSS